MSPWMYIASFGAGVVLAFLREGRARTIGMLIMLATGAASLGAIAGPQQVAWLAGPVVASLVLTTRPEAGQLPFEALMLRTAIAGAIFVAGITAGVRLPVGDTPWPMTAVFWLTGCAGVAWLAVPRDSVEAARGAVLAIAGGASLLLAVAPSGVVTAALAGLLTLVPVAAVRFPPVPAQLSRAVGPGLLVLAGAAAGGALLGLGATRSAIGDLGLDFAGTVAAGLALLFLVAAVHGELRGLAVLAGGLSLVATAPALRWAGLAALLAGATLGRAGRDWTPWAGVVFVGLGPLLAAVVSSPRGGHWEATMLATGWLVLAIGALTSPSRALLLPASTLLVMQAMARLPSADLARAEWLVAAGILVLGVHATASIVQRVESRSPVYVGDRLMLGLLLIALATGAPLGILAAFLLLLHLALVGEDTGALDETGMRAALGQLGRSGWPPAVAFAARALTVVAALQVSWGLGALAASLVALLQLAPLIDARGGPAPARRSPAGTWLTTLVSLGAGAAPAALLRLLHL